MKLTSKRTSDLFDTAAERLRKQQRTLRTVCNELNKALAMLRADLADANRRIGERDVFIEEMKKRLHGYDAQQEVDQRTIRKLERDLESSRAVTDMLVDSLRSTGTRLVVAPTTHSTSDFCAPRPKLLTPAAREAKVREERAGATQTDPETGLSVTMRKDGDRVSFDVGGTVTP